MDIHDNTAEFEASAARRRSRELANELVYRSIMKVGPGRRVGAVTALFTPEEIAAIKTQDILNLPLP